MRMFHDVFRTCAFETPDWIHKDAYLQVVAIKGHARYGSFEKIRSSSDM